MYFLKKCPFLTITVIITVILFIYGMLLAAKVVKASNSVNLDNDPETVGVATAVQDIKARMQNYIDGVNERDYTIDYMPTEYVPDDDLINAFTPSDKAGDDGELTDEEKADRVLNSEEDEQAAARRAERSEKMKNGETDEVIRDAFKTKLEDNDRSSTGDSYDGFYSVGDSYFDSPDTVIIGDSREQGFGLYSGYSNMVSFAQKSYAIHQIFTKKWIDSEYGKLTLEEAMAANQGKFKKIYIKFGLNEMGWADEEAFDNAYYQMIDMIKYYQPDAVIYIQSIICVTKSKSETSNVFNNKNIYARNEALKVVAEKEHVAYLDLNSVMADSEGNLPEDFASDGIHIKQKYMYIWTDFLKSHAVANGNSDELISDGGGYVPSENVETPDTDDGADALVDGGGETENTPEPEEQDTTVSEDQAADTASDTATDTTGGTTGSSTTEPVKSGGDWETGDGIN